MIKRYYPKFVKFMKNTNLMRKLMIIYLGVVFLPGILIVYIMDFNYYKILWEKYCLNVDDIYSSEVETLDVRLADISNVSTYFSSNSMLLEYADTGDMSVADSVYNYMKYIGGIFQNVRSSHQYISSLTVYTEAQHTFELAGILENLETNSVPEEVYTQVYGVWNVENNEEQIVINYYYPLYRYGYQNFVGVLKVEVDPQILLNCLTEETVYFISDDKKIQFIKQKDQLRMLDESEEIEKFEESRFSHVSESHSESLQGIFRTKFNVPLDFSRALLVMLIPSLIILMLLPILYLQILSRHIKRIVDFSDYIGKDYAPDPKPYKAKIDSDDEIGRLIKTYNYYIGEIKRLVIAVDKAELQRKDSEFYALQAQIKPHFLYNTLENIRMTAEQENDARTSAMLEILGGYLRYGLMKDLKYTYLRRELQHIKYYQQLMDIRFPGKIKLRIAVFTDISYVTCPYLLLQPIVENAIQHGREPEETIEISVEIREAETEITERDDRKDKKDIEIKIANNGYKIEEGRLKELQCQLYTGISDEDGHVGLNNINYRLISCYGHEYYMRINNREDQGCVFTIYLPDKEDID